MKNELDLNNSINLASLLIGIINYQENLTQNDKQDIMKNLSNASDMILKQVQEHLGKQDKKIDQILEILNEKLY